MGTGVELIFIDSLGENKFDSGTFVGPSCTSASKINSVIVVSAANRPLAGSGQG